MKPFAPVPLSPVQPTQHKGSLLEGDTQLHFPTGEIHTGQVWRRRHSPCPHLPVYHPPKSYTSTPELFCPYRHAETDYGRVAIYLQDSFLRWLHLMQTSQPLQPKERTLRSQKSKLSSPCQRNNLEIPWGWKKKPRRRMQEGKQLSSAANKRAGPQLIPASQRLIRTNAALKQAPPSGNPAMPESEA